MCSRADEDADRLAGSGVVFCLWRFGEACNPQALLGDAGRAQGPRDGAKARSGEIPRVEAVKPLVHPEGLDFDYAGCASLLRDAGKARSALRREQGFTMREQGGGCEILRGGRLDRAELRANALQGRVALRAVRLHEDEETHKQQAEIGEADDPA